MKKSVDFPWLRRSAIADKGFTTLPAVVKIRLVSDSTTSTRCGFVEDLLLAFDIEANGVRHLALTFIIIIKRQRAEATNMS